jgi:hypothetical protein
MTSILAAILDNEDEGYRPEMVEGEWLRAMMTFRTPVPTRDFTFPDLFSMEEKSIDTIFSLYLFGSSFSLGYLLLVTIVINNNFYLSWFCGLTGLS